MPVTASTGRGGDPPDLDREARTTQVPRWLVPTLTVLGMLAAVVGGLSAERMYRQRLAVLLAEANLDHARSLAQFADNFGDIRTDKQLVDAVEALWKDSELPYEMVDVCLISQDGRYLLHTGNNDLVGQDCRKDRLDPPRPQMASIGDLLSKGVDWAGRQIAGDGNTSVVAYSYEPDLGVLVGVHVRADAVARAVRTTGLPWFGALALLAGVLVPLQLLVLHRAWREARHRSNRLRDREREVQARLAATERMVSLGTLAAGVAHEINNPLTYILGNLDQALERLPPELLDRPLDGTTLGGLIEGARHGALRVHEVVRDLRVISRDEARETAEPFDVREAVERALRLVSGEVERRGRLSTELTNVPPVVGHPGRLEQVLVNLAVNAAQALPEDGSGQVRVTLGRSPEGWVELRVEDTGHGMPAEVLERVFEPFFTTKPVGVGTGLGLHITRALVESLAGRIELHSSPGEGTTAIVRLPPAPGRAEAAGEQSERGEPPREGAPDEGAPEPEEKAAPEPEEKAAPEPEEKATPEPEETAAPDPEEKAVPERSAPAPGAHGHPEETPATEPAPNAAPPEPAPERPRILFVDDEPELGHLVRRILANQYDVVVTHSGAEALALLDADARFELVLCDLVMPDMGGLMLYEAIRARHPALADRFVLTTGGRTNGAGDQAAADLEVLEKPFRASQIEALLARRTGRA